MKVRTSIKKICASCKTVRRGRKNFVSCAANPRHKQRQGFHTLVDERSASADTAWAEPVAVPSLERAATGSFATLFGLR